jgi:hypothetical protein
MKIEPLPLGPRRARFNENEAKHCTCCDEHPPCTREKTSVSQQAKERKNKQNRRNDSG